MTGISLRTRALESVVRMQLNGGKNLLPKDGRVFYNMTTLIKKNVVAVGVPSEDFDNKELHPIIINEIIEALQPNIISVTEVLPPQENYIPSKELNLEWMDNACKVSPEANAYLRRMLNSPCGSLGWWDL